MKSWLLQVLVAALLLGGASRSNAQRIYYEEESTGVTGSIGSTNFYDTDVTVVFNGDISNVTSFLTSSGLYYANEVGSTSIEIDGVGTYSFADPVWAVDAQFGGGYIGLDGNNGGDVILSNVSADSTYLTYNLQAPIGPITSDQGFAIGAPFETSGGFLILSEVEAPYNFTFTAGLGYRELRSDGPSTPEPGSIASILSLCAAGVGILRRKRVA